MANDFKVRFYSGIGAQGPQGPKGDQGNAGPTGPRGPVGYHYTPNVSSNGDLTWTNDGDLENPAPVNLTDKFTSTVAEASAAVSALNADVTALQTSAAALSDTIAQAQSAVDGIEAQRDTIIQSIEDAAELGTDTTLSTPGMAADAKAAGLAINQLGSSLLVDVVSTVLFIVGAISSSSGADSASANSTRLRTLDSLLGNIVKISVSAGYKYMLFGFDGSTYKGTWSGSAFAKSANWRTVDTDLTQLPATYTYKLVFAKSDDAALSPSDVSNNLTLYSIADRTLSHLGRAADAYATSVAFSRITEPTANLYNGPLPRTKAADGNGIINLGVIDEVPATFTRQIYPAGTYSGVINVSSDSSSSTCKVAFTKEKTYSDSNTIVAFTIQKNHDYYFTFTSEFDIRSIFAFADNSVSGSSGHAITVNRFHIQAGSTMTEYAPSSITAVDYKARSMSFLSSTGDQTDRATEIADALLSNGVCTLGKGNFYVSGVVMPEHTTLRGIGDATKVILIDGVPGSAIKMSYGCSVQDLTVLGAADDIERDGVFIGAGADTSGLTNCWEDGDISVTTSGYLQMVLTEPLPAGAYKVTATVESDNPSTVFSRIYFSNSQTTSIGTANLIGDVSFRRGDEESAFVILHETAYSVRILSGTNISNSDGYSAEYSDIKIVSVGGRNGIEWSQPDKDSEYQPEVMFGSINNCRILHFDCAGILLQDTGTPVRRNALISNCHIRNNNVGIYIRRDGEFHKIVNCSVTGNYYGMLNRGGNNIITNCGFDGNIVGVQIDNAEGTNGGHGSISNCTINHSDSNKGYGLIVEGTGRELISNCNIHFSKIRFKNTNGNILSNCQIGNSATIEIVGGQCNMVIGCIMRTATENTVTLVSNTKSKVVNCYTRDGVEVVATKT